MHLLRCLHFFCAHFDIALWARHNSQGTNPDPPIPVRTPGDIKARLAISLEGVVQQLIERSMAPMTARSYRSAQNFYIDFCR